MHVVRTMKARFLFSMSHVRRWGGRRVPTVAFFQTHAWSPFCVQWHACLLPKVSALHSRAVFEGLKALSCISEMSDVLRNFRV